MPVKEGGVIVSALEFCYRVQASDRDTDGMSIPLHAFTRSRGRTHNAGKIRKTAASPTPLFIRSPAVDTDPTRKVDGSVSVVEHGNTREHATLIELSRETSGPVTDTGGQDDFRPGVGDLTGKGDGAMEWPGDVDYFRVDVAGTGSLRVETTDSTDTVGSLEGANSQSLVENGNDGEGNNFRVVRQVQAGTYYVVVNGAENRQVLGTCSLTVRFTPMGGGTTRGGGASQFGGNTLSGLGGNTPPAGRTPPASGTPPKSGRKNRPPPPSGQDRAQQRDNGGLLRGSRGHGLLPGRRSRSGDVDSGDEWRPAYGRALWSAGTACAAPGWRSS